MSREDWKSLVARYAAGRPLCNCKEAYYTPCGHGIDGNGERRTDLLVCQYGCEANRLFCRDEIAGYVIAELPGVSAFDVGGAVFLGWSPDDRLDSECNNSHEEI